MRVIGKIFIIILFTACSSSVQREIAWALEQAGENRQHLEAVLHHYSKDSLKYEAASFLIKNMPYHFSVVEYFVSPDDEIYRPDLTLFKDDEVETHCDSLTRNGYIIRKYNEYDIVVIDSTYLINNIDLAFDVWQKPWARNVSYIDFCKYILPYRSQQEMLSGLRKEMKQRFISILDSVNVNTPLEDCLALNDEMSKIMRYAKTGLPFYPTIEDTYYGGVSQCEGLCDLGTMIMRSVGIPVAIDQTVWVRMDLGHNWCAVLDNGQFYPFGPGEDSPERLANKFRNSHRHKPGKVYRFNFEPDLSKQDNPQDDGYKTFLKNIMLDDVTTEYTDKPVNIEVTIDEEIKPFPTSDQVYLCTYNDNIWKPLAIGKRTGYNCHFGNVAGDNIYCVFYSPDGTFLRRITIPFYVNREGEINKLILGPETQSYTLKKRPNRLYLPHVLRYWEPEKGNFISLEYKESTDTTQYYDNIPENVMLWFSVPERIHNQRPFIIENDSLRYY